MSKPDPLSWTLRFKKHKTTVLLMLPAQESIPSTKEKLHNALKSRNVREINGDPVPENPADIEFGVPIDRNELEKGWVRLALQTGEAEHEGKNGAGRPKKGSLADSLQGADIRDGQAIAFRFKRASGGEGDGAESDEDFADAGWDVVLPSLDDEEPE
ncbi:hypothetical protein UA08_08338 [Talaromyces atroroseus]|uniref:Uncharacterized protein n=1 Tax=Talaromyces atroroseus TaxID=1441469 RepID=A0A225AC31_TALAT|nr:hypothetical protein UA08_08338 [Talaromyces atroroseus]OKL56383.1 hypothetical protein UA08_08338 [Talaromyces atroroseus]